MNKRANRILKKAQLSVTGDAPAVDVTLFAACVDRADLEDVRKARRDIASHGTVPWRGLSRNWGFEWRLITP